MLLPAGFITTAMTDKLTRRPKGGINRGKIPRSQWAKHSESHRLPSYLAALKPAYVNPGTTLQCDGGMPCCEPALQSVCKSACCAKMGPEPTHREGLIAPLTL